MATPSKSTIPGSTSTPRMFSRTHPPTVEDDIVITGVSGKFPNSANMHEYAHNLYNKIDMVDDVEKRWRNFNPEIPSRMGKIDNLEKFDATFFGVHFKQAHTMDPQCRLLIEAAYEAVLDAGMNPRSLRGSRTGVFMGCCFSESENTWFYEKVSSGGFGITGCSRAMLANRISYTLGLNGPSFTMDTACSSSMYALDMAFTAIRNNECDAAFIGGANLLLHPYVTLQFARLGVLAKDGYCRPFDVDATGYTRSEAVCVVYLQKARDAKRVYGSVLYSKTNCDGYKEEGITFPSGRIQQQLLTKFYQEIGIDPATVDYVEAHSTGTVVGDPEECNALDNVFCKNRKKPLPVGSVKSNLGHAEASSGACSIAKVILAFETGIIPPNINFKRVRPGIASLEEGRLKVVSDPTPLEGPLIGINSFGFGGANAHALLRANPKVKINNGAPSDSLPRLVNWSGRTEEACTSIFSELTTRSLDAEYIGLLHNTQSDSISGNVFRGYGVFAHKPKENATVITKDVQHYTGLKRPLVWVFSGMGSQWTEMGTGLLEIPIFHASIKRCHDVLAPKGLDLINILTSKDPTTYDNILHSFVGIAAVQIAIVDILRVLDIEPDYILGHSVGELGCAYADRCFTAEQMILSAYSRGMASLETKKIRGSMAAIGLGFSNIQKLLPPSIDVACHNGPDSCTISGPENDLKDFVNKLKAQGIFAKEVACSNIAYHSRYISDMGPILLSRLRQVITDAKPRSAKWLSSSVPKSRWDTEESKYSSAEYHTNNLLSSVLFEETSSLLPNNALTIEIAPHGLLQAILKKSLPNAVHVPLTQRENKNSTTFFLVALGKLFLNGLTMPIERLYPKIEFPVSRGTPMISPLIRWDHSEDWFVTKFEKLKRTGERHVKVTITDQDFEFVTGHIIDGRCLFPATAYLLLVWETFGMMRGPIFYDTNIEFEDIKFLRATSLAKGVEIVFTIMIHQGTGAFEITEGSVAVVTGVIKEMEPNTPMTDMPPLEDVNQPMLQQKDFYKELRLRGYHYNGLFRSVLEARGDGLFGRIKWDLNWVAFLDCLLQVQIIGKDTRSLYLPTRIEKMRIDAKKHLALLAQMDQENPIFDVQSSTELGILQSGGVEIFGLNASPVGRRKPPGVPVLETYKFIPFLPAPKLQKDDAVRICVQIALENLPMLKVKAVEVDMDNATAPIIQLFEEALGDLPLVTSELMFLTTQELDLGKVHVEDGKLLSQSNCLFIIGSKCIDRTEFIDKAKKCLTESGFLVSREPLDIVISEIQCPIGFNLITTLPVENECLVLFQRIRRTMLSTPSVIKVSDSDVEMKWLDTLKSVVKTDSVVLVVEQEPNNGIIGLVNCLRKEPDGGSAFCVFIDDPKAPAFDMDVPFYKNQLKLGLAINVYRNGQWGSYRHLMLRQNLGAKPTSNHAFANILQGGDLSTIKWMEGPLNVQSRTDIVNVHYSSLNFRDVMMATGRLMAEVAHVTRLDECYLGFEYSGITQDGLRVMGTVCAGALSTQVILDPIMRWVVPDDMSLKEAATIPVVYMTVYMAFFFKASIKKGKSILIHAGSGGVGLAAIRVALAYGLEVFTTVSTPQKKQFILEQFPTLKECNIGHSRSISFERMVKIQTKGKGVDYVLNSLADDKLLASVRCLGVGGIFLEIGKVDMANNTKLGLGHFLNELSFHAVLVDLLLVGDSPLKTQIGDMISRDIKRGIIKPIPSTLFRVGEEEQAFRYMASGKHVGKILLEIRKNAEDKVSYPITVIPRIYCDPDRVYIIAGGLGGFGLELTDWLVIRRARKIVLSSSRGITKMYQAYRIRIWESYGCAVIVSTADITKKDGCEKLLREAMTLGPIGGIFNLAVQLRDAILDNQDVKMFNECMAPKALATKHLDDLSRKMCPQLNYFVVFSSVSCGRGNGGQTNYGMANSVMERIIESRHAQGLPAKAIQWGAVGEVGLVADMQEDKLDMEIGGTLQQRISSCLHELDELLTHPDPITASMVVAEKRAGSGGKINLIDTVLNIMSIRDIKSISMEATLSEMGMDSLMAVEIKQTLEREFEIFLAPQDLRSLTFGKLQELTSLSEKDGTENVKLKLASDDRPLGLEVMIRNLGDETASEETILRLVSLNNSEKFTTTALIIPGIEGVVGSSWHTIAESLNMPAFALQLTNTFDMTSIEDITTTVFDQVLNEVFKNLEFFYLVGYSFGAYVTLEIARRLEALGMKGNVLLIDGAPEFLKKLSHGQIASEITDEAIQIMLVSSIALNVFPDENTDEIRLLLMRCKTWAEKLDKLLDLNKHKTVYSENYLRKMTNALYNRLKIVFSMNDNNSKPIKSPITLVRPTEVAVVDIEEDYDVSKITTGAVTLKFIEGNHSSILENSKLVQIINDFDPGLQSSQSFKAYIQAGGKKC